MVRRHLWLGAVALVAVMALSIGPAGAATVTQVVRSTTVSGWFGLNEGPTGSVGTSTLVTGPGTPPAGAGSAKLVVDSNGRASLGTLAYAGLKFADLTSLDYWVYPTTSSTYPVLQFDVDFNTLDANTTYQGRLSFISNTPAPANTWTHWNALTDGTWYGSQLVSPDPCFQGSPCTTAQVNSAYPSLGIRNAPDGKGALILRLGGPIGGGATVYTDKLTVGTATNTTIVDFEPGASITPSSGPAGGTVLAQAGGFKPNSRVRFRYRSFVRKKQWVLLCRVKANAAGDASCLQAIPSGTAAGPVGVHPVRIQGRTLTGPLQYNPDFLLTP